MSPEPSASGPSHIWISCPGCGYGGEIGVPADYPADAVVCPNCRQVVNVRPEDRILWRSVTTDEFMEKRFPGVDWKNIDSSDERESEPEFDAPLSQNDATRTDRSTKWHGVRFAAVSLFAMCVLFFGFMGTFAVDARTADGSETRIWFYVFACLSAALAMWVARRTR